jgi:hypothetical protein
MLQTLMFNLGPYYKFAGENPDIFRIFYLKKTIIFGKTLKETYS